MTRLLLRLGSSVRIRVTATALVAVALALGFSATVLERSLQHDRQRILQSTADEQAKIVEQLNKTLDPNPVIPLGSDLEMGLVQVVVKGKVVGASRPLRNLPPLWSPGDPYDQDTTEVLPGLTQDVHVVAVPVSRGADQGTIVVVTSLQQYDRSLAYLQRLLLDGTPVLLFVVGCISWLAVGRSLRPIELMRREVADVVGVTAGHRVAEPATDDEVGRLARTLNSMLDRIQASSARERRFVSDASHELRSPIANIRTELEVALHHPHIADWEQVATDVLSQNDRMEKLVSSLLILARSDEGSLPQPGEPVDLAEVVSAVSGSIPPAPLEAPRPALEVRTQPAPVRVPQVYLERIIGNLVDNAVRFASSRVRLEVRAEDGWAVLEVADDGPGVPAEASQRIFERFHRLDEARNRGKGGFGLGLAIVADLTRFYGGTIEVRQGSPGAVFVLRLPGVGTPAQAPVLV